MSNIATNRQHTIQSTAPSKARSTAREFLEAEAFERISSVVRMVPPSHLTMNILVHRAGVSAKRVEAWARLNPHVVLNQPRKSS